MDLAALTRLATTVPRATSREVTIRLRGVWRVGQYSTALALATGAVAVLLWLFALSQTDPDAMGDFGLLSVLPVPYYLALLLVIANASIILYRGKQPEYVFWLHAALLIFMIHGTPHILYGTLRYSWAWKHVGIIDYIQRHGTVDPHIGLLSAYHNWPGFFTLNTLLVEVAGLKNALAFAGWAPVFFNLIDLGALLLIYRSRTRDRRLIGLAIWFFFLTNWVGQDYFSPQATGYFLHLVILGICLTWFKLSPTPHRKRVARWVRHGRLATWTYKLLLFARRAELPVARSTAGQRVGLLLLVILVFASIASTHQLTPVMTVASLMALVVVQRLSLRGLPVIFALIVALWISYMAVAYLEPTVESFIEALRNPAENAELIDLSLTSHDQRVVALVGRTLSVLVIGLAGLGILRLLRRGIVHLPLLVLIAASVGIMGVTAYGGEIIFRVYLFSLPFFAFFIAALFYPAPEAGTSWRTPVLSALLSVVMLTGLLFAYYGKERQFYFAPDEVEASEYLFSIAPPRTLIIEGNRSYPSQYRNYEDYTYVAIDREPFASRWNLASDPVGVLTRWMGNRGYSEAYLIITRSQKATSEMVGSMFEDTTLADIEQALLEAARFQVIYRSPNAVIFRLDRELRNTP